MYLTYSCTCQRTREFQHSCEIYAAEFNSCPRNMDGMSRDVGRIKSWTKPFVFISINFFVPAHPRLVTPNYCACRGEVSNVLSAEEMFRARDAWRKSGVHSDRISRLDYYSRELLLLVLLYTPSPLLPLLSWIATIAIIIFTNYYHYYNCDWSSDWRSHVTFDGTQYFHIPLRPIFISYIRICRVIVLLGIIKSADYADRELYIAIAKMRETLS